MSFKAYLDQRRPADTPSGDFVEDARRDRQMPDVQSWTALKTYLEGRGADYIVLDAARTTWASYLAWKRAQARKERYAEAIRRAASGPTS